MPDQIRYLDPSEVRAYERAESVNLRVEIVGERTILNAQLRRVFPLSEPRRYISIRDGAGTEFGILKDMDGLDPVTMRLFDGELDRRYFTPTIGRIDDLKMEAGMWRFTVDTQRGPAEFYVRNWRDSAVELSPGRWHINSVDGGRFEIKDVEVMDLRSRRLMDQLL